jgi:hypothetical protein
MNWNWKHTLAIVVSTFVGAFVGYLQSHVSGAIPTTLQAGEAMALGGALVGITAVSHLIAQSPVPSPAAVNAAASLIAKRVAIAAMVTLVLFVALLGACTKTQANDAGIALVDLSNAVCAPLTVIDPAAAPFIDFGCTVANATGTALSTFTVREPSDEALIFAAKHAAKPVVQ